MKVDDRKHETAARLFATVFLVVVSGITVGQVLVFQSVQQQLW